MSNYSRPDFLTENSLIVDFDCGEDSLNRWLVEKAWKNHVAGNSKTYVVNDGERVVAYYSLHVGSVYHELLSAADKRNSPDPVPAIVIGRLAVDLKHQGKGIATYLIQFIYSQVLLLSEKVGAKLLIVNAIDADVVDFYVNLGFKASKIEPLLLLLSVSKLKASLTDAKDDSL